MIGLPGETLELREKKVYINGTPLDEPYVHFLRRRRRPSEFHEVTSFDVRERYGPVTVPPNQYFVMGDNRDNSQDSRYWGFLPRDYVKGKALVIYWSYEAGPRGLPGGRRRRDRARARLGLRALLHAHALGPDVPPDPLMIGCAQARDRGVHGQCGVASVGRLLRALQVQGRGPVDDRSSTADKPEQEVRARILDLAAQYDMPVTEANFTLRREERSHHRRRLATCVPSSCFPGFQIIRSAFNWHVDTPHLCRVALPTTVASRLEAPRPLPSWPAPTAPRAVPPPRGRVDVCRVRHAPQIDLDVEARAVKPRP